MKAKTRTRWMFLSCCLVTVGVTQAASTTWNNGGTDFNNGANWTNGLPGSGDNATFLGAASVQPELSADITIQGLTFSGAGATGYDFTQIAGSLTLTNTGAGVSSAIYAQNTSGLNTIDAPIVLGGAAATTATFTQAGTGGSLHISGNISSTNAITGLKLLGEGYAGPITLSGSNTYAGSTTLDGNAKTQLNINSARAISSGDLVAPSAATIDNTSGSSVTLVNNNDILLGGTLLFAGSNDLSFGSGVLTVNAATQGTVTVNGGVLTVGSIDATDTAKTFRKIGAGTLAVTGAAGVDFQGGFALNAGTLLIGNKTSMGGGGVTVIGNAILSSSTDLTGANAVTNNVSLGSNFSVGGSNDLELSGTISQSSGARIVTVANDATTTLSGVANSYTGATILSGATTVLEVAKLANGGTNSSIGASSNAAANLRLADGNTLRYIGSGDSTDRLFTMNGTNAVLEASGSGAVQFTNTAGISHASSGPARHLVLTGTNTGDNTFSGALANNGVGVFSLSKTGAGTWVLGGNNTYTGTTAVNLGTLVLSGNMSNSSTVTVSGGGEFRYNSATARTGTVSLNGSGNSSRAVLSGTGAINVAITLDDLGDTLSPGNSPGIQTFGVSQSWDSFTYVWETNNFTGTTAGTDFDQIGITGGLTLNGSGNFQLDLHSLTAGNVAGDVPNFSEANTSWTILTTTTGIAGFDADNWTILDGSFTSSPAWAGLWSIDQVGNNLVLSYAAVPEPGTWLLAAIGLSVVSILRRRR